MHEIKFPQSESKRRLLDAAEKLFADRGFEAVSVRDVTQLAKANVAAINYHFGNRDGLIASVVTRYMTPINEQRLARLDTLERKWTGKAVPLEEAIDALVRPLVGMVRKSELSERLFCKLLGRISSMQGDGMPPAVEDQIKALSIRFTRAFSKSLPSVSQEDLVWRTHFVVGAMIHMLMSQEMLIRLTNGACGTPTMEATLSRFIRFAAAGLREGVEPIAESKKGPQALFEF
ncbi:MAG: TetR/AcrR family transcriptional regulator [Gloeobacteraceae cyanobacterium ES-bin-144]|nr:TetR/AcrR family transcriptional regulator [Verrucomicrobiales bacterium]